jgi:hypothetical protein
MSGLQQLVKFFFATQHAVFLAHDVHILSITVDIVAEVDHQIGLKLSYVCEEILLFILMGA